MAVTALHIDVIVSNPTIRNGSPIINGTTIRVSDLVAYHTTGDKLTAEQLAENFKLSMGQVYAALAYYHLHKTKIDAEIAQSQMSPQEEEAVLREAFKDMNVRWPDPTANPHPEIEEEWEEIYKSLKGCPPLSELIIEERGEF